MSQEHRPNQKLMDEIIAGLTQEQPSLFPHSLVEEVKALTLMVNSLRERVTVLENDIPHYVTATGKKLYNIPSIFK